MKRIFYSKIFVLAILVFSLCTVSMRFTPTNVAHASSLPKATYTCDYYTGSVISATNENQRFQIASMVKIMTALIVFEEIDRGNISTDDKVVVSTTAGGMGGSQMFLSAGSEYTISDLLKGLIVVSGNDCSVQLAEVVSGSESAFVAKMNERANQLGMADTLFSNCTGLPSTEEQYCSAKDVSIMFRELIKHPLYFDYSKVWIEDYVHPDGHITQLVNTNKLIRFYNGCDGGKTGYTSQARYCLASTAKRGDTRIVNVIIGAEDSKSRFAEASNTYNYAFANYESVSVLKTDVPLDTQLSVRGANVDSVSLIPISNLTIFGKRGEVSKSIKIDYELPSFVKAPIKIGEQIGVARVVYNGVEYEVGIGVSQEILPINYPQSIAKIVRNW